MEKQEKPIFEDDLTPEQRERQRAAFAKERRQEEEKRRTGEALLTVATVLDILTGK